MAFSFGASQPAQTPAFGANPPASSGFSFGTTAPASSASFSFGTTTQPTTGFGTGTAAPSFGFGTSSAPTNTFGGFGTTVTSQAPSFGFGTSSAAPTLGGFGATTTQAPTIGFGTSSAAPAFGSTTFGGLGATTSAPLSFGTSTSAAPSFGFGATTSTPSTGGFGLSAATSIATTSATPSTGLGGVSSTPFGATTNTGQSESKAYGETTVPAEIVQTVEDFKKYVKEQKAKKDEVSRGSSKAPEKVSEEVEGLKNILSSLVTTIQQQTAIVHKLKLDAALEIKNAEIAQRTKETAPSMQLDNTAPLEYFARLIADFEQRMQFYKQQIEDTERNLVAMNRQQSLTPQELMNTMKKLHEAFVLLAGRVHHIHTSLQNYKDDYLAFRRRALGDPSDIFARKDCQSAQSKPGVNQSILGVGPSPFGGASDPISRTLLTNGHQQGANPANTSLNFGSTLANNSFSATGNQFGTPGRPSGIFGGSTQLAANNSSFQLQSPPPGNKRNKR